MADRHNLRGYDFVEFYVGSARASAYYLSRALGLTVSGYSGPETGVRDRTSFWLTKGRLQLVLTSALAPSTDEILSFTQRHGDGVRRWAVQVDDVPEAFAEATKNGAVAAFRPRRLEDAQGLVEEAGLRLYDDTELVFINRERYRGVFRPGFTAPRHSPPAGEDSALACIDHIVGNVRVNEMDAWAAWYERTLGFDTFIDFKAGDIGTRFSALLSKVVRSPNRAIKNPINEPYPGLKRSQIEEFLEEYRGTGVQHIAIASADLLSTVRVLRQNGVEFLDVPPAYYQALRARKDLHIAESIDDLERLGILCDIEGQGYLLQLFTRPIGDRPTFFFEFIQRREGAQGFGKGNFQALFEALELEQHKRGNL
ncbi:MAG: 4-hydroxyphenylpyruvate dioxygenase [Deltaproteobacteria bacterium]|nr:4-hydroxyphenylpyruvate dioxygenase [Deltaproteobacteria bacterium]